MYSPKITYPMRSQSTLSLPHENIRKHFGFLMFPGGRERVHWELIGYTTHFKQDSLEKAVNAERNRKTLSYLFNVS